MSSLWVFVLALTVGGMVAIALFARRTHREIEPTVRAFAEFRAALQPAVGEVRIDATTARDRLHSIQQRSSSITPSA